MMDFGCFISSDKMMLAWFLALMNDGPLDMRMNPDKGISAAQWFVRTVREKDMAESCISNGEERFFVAWQKANFVNTVSYANSNNTPTVKKIIA